MINTSDWLVNEIALNNNKQKLTDMNNYHFINEESQIGVFDQSGSLFKRFI